MSMHKTILQFSFIRKFLAIHPEHNYISQDNKRDYYFINLGKLFWDELFTFKIYKTYKCVTKQCLRLVCLIMKLWGAKSNSKRLEDFIINNHKCDEKKASLKEFCSNLGLFFKIWSKVLNLKIIPNSIFYNVNDRSFSDIKKKLEEEKKNLIFSWLSNKIETYIQKHNPFLLCFEITNLTDFINTMAVASMIKGKYDVKIFIIKHWFENFNLTDLFLNKPEIGEFIFRNIDYCVFSKDYNENHILDKLSSLLEVSDFESVSNIDGLCGKFGRHIFINNQNPDKEQDILVSYKFYNDLTRNVFYSENITSATLRNSKCHWCKCNFCIQNSKYITQTKKVLNFDKIRKLNKEFNYKYFFFSDEAIRPRDIREFIDYIKKENLNIYWEIRCTLSKDLCDDQLLQDAYQYGCREILFGQESFNPITLQNMNKTHQNLSLNEMVNVFDKIISNKMVVYLNMIYYYPGQTVKDIIGDLNTCLNLRNKYGHKVWFNYNHFALFYKSDCYEKITDDKTKAYYEEIDHYPLDKAVFYETSRLNESKEFISGKTFRLVTSNSDYKIDSKDMYTYKALVDSAFSFRSTCENSLGREGALKSFFY